MAVTELEQLVSDSVDQTDSDPKIHQFSAPKLVWIVVQGLTSVQIHQLQNDLD